MANTGLRPDESARLEFRDVAIVTDEATGERILEIEVRGKRGVGYCKSMTGAVMPFERLRNRNRPNPLDKSKKPEPTDKLFGPTNYDLLNAILDELNLKYDRDGNRRTAYSLRHTYICLRLMEGADIYQIAKNCRTSVEMIETFYASHIKNTLDAAAINVRKAKPTKKADQPTTAEDD
jgi:integrase